MEDICSASNHSDDHMKPHLQNEWCGLRSIDLPGYRVVVLAKRTCVVYEMSVVY